MYGRKINDELFAYLFIYHCFLIWICDMAEELRMIDRKECGCKQSRLIITILLSLNLSGGCKKTT
jgi:hypothetical protein